MKKKTSNTEHRTLKSRWAREARVAEGNGEYSAEKKTSSTSNAQRPTSNAQLKKERRYDLEDRLLDFAARLIRLVDALPNTRAATHVAGQLLRSGTSPYGHHGEVEAAESRRDFIHKLKICLKELKETRRWLRLVHKSEMLPEKKMQSILGEAEELIRIFFKSTQTAEKNAK